ncbi:hypothetical protein MMC29_007535 [Sticta canariensis]|nr:hypothetical protein [Sticta canariensis]
MEGYWRDRMKEALAEQVPANREELRRIGVLIKRSEDESENESKDELEFEWKVESDDDSDRCPIVPRPDPLEPGHNLDGDTTDCLPALFFAVSSGFICRIKFQA